MRTASFYLYVCFVSLLQLFANGRGSRCIFFFFWVQRIFYKVRNWWQVLVRASKVRCLPNFFIFTSEINVTLKLTIPQRATWNGPYLGIKQAILDWEWEVIWERLLLSRRHVKEQPFSPRTSLRALMLSETLPPSILLTLV